MISIRKNFIYNSILSVSRVLFPLISFPYSSRVLGPDGIGRVNFIDGYTQYFVLVAALGIPVYGVREVARAKSDRVLLGKTISELITLNFLISLGCCIFYFAIAFATHKYQVYGDLYMLGAVILVLSTFVAEWFFQGMESFKYISLRSLVLNSLSIVLLFILVKTRSDIFWYYGINVIILAANVIMNMSMLNKEVPLKFKNLSLRRHLKPLFLLFSTQVAISVYLMLDKVLLGYMSEDKYVGFYSASLRVTKILLTLISALALVMMPQMSKAFHDMDAERVKTLYRKSSNFVITVGIPISIGLICLSDEIIALIAGKAFLPASTSLKIVAPTILIIGLSNIFGMQILTANGKEKILLRCVTVGTVVNVLVNVLLIPYWKHNGTAMAILITELFVTVAAGYYACKEIHARFDWWSILVNCAVCIPFFLIHYYCAFGSNALTILVCMILCSIYYTLVQVFLLKNELWVTNYIRLKEIVFK